MNDKNFQIDAVKMMREIRNEIDEEINGMNYEEEKAYINKQIGHILDKYRTRKEKEDDKAA